MRLIDRLDRPTKSDLIPIFEKLSSIEVTIVYIITKINYNLFVFIAGIFASLSINLLTNLVAFRLADIIYFIIFICTISSSITLTYHFSAFTIRYIELRDMTSRETNLEKYINRTFELCTASLPYLKRKFIFSIIFSILTLITIVGCFLRSNLEFNF